MAMKPSRSKPSVLAPSAVHPDEAQTTNPAATTLHGKRVQYNEASALGSVPTKAKAAVVGMGLMAAISSLVGAGTSFSPLYVDIWGGMMLHPNCPALGSRPAQTGENGLCVTAPSWFLLVTLSCVCCAVLFAIAFTHTAERLSRWHQRGNVENGHGDHFRYVDKVNAACIVLSCVAVAALVIISGELGMAALVVVWWLMAFVALRVLALMGPIVSACVPALLIGFGPVLFTQVSLVGSFTVSGGLFGAIMCSAATFALQRIHVWLAASETVNGASAIASDIAATSAGAATDATVPTADAKWKDRIPQGLIAQLFVVLLAFLSCVQYSTLHTTMIKLCPAFSASASGGLIDSCTSQQTLDIIRMIALVGVPVSACLAVAAAITAVLRLPRLTKSLMVVSSACAGMVLVIAFSIA
ncbi:MAG: hypothetical protein ABF747_03520 [Bifidobacterium sp.]|uniref:Uncharacterized protein n=1 Tax=Bifidobacterium fermentum TaxID=3059035 RepID=A0AB39UDS6_9BIFI